MGRTRPNIVFVMADDMGYGDFGLFNNGLSETPALDELAGTGLCLAQHYSASCVCTPARAGLLTGRYPHRTGAIEMRSIRGLDRLALRERTIADEFREAGYVTGLVGKWHTGVYGDAYHPNRRGFDEFFGFRGGLMDYYESRIERNGMPLKPDGTYLTDRFTAEAVDFVRRHRDEPFFLCLHYNAPHTPLQAPEEELEPFLGKSGLSRGVALVYTMIKRMDTGVNRVREELRRLGLESNTLFCLTSDNGPQFGGWDGVEQTRYNGGLNGSKGHVYEGGIRVPMLLSWPEGGLAGGKTIDDFVHFTDWLPTLLSAAGAEPGGPLPLDGVNVLSALRGEKGKVNPLRFWQWNRYTPVAACNAAMRDGDWKLVRPVIDKAMWTSPEEMAMDRVCETDPAAFTDILRGPEPERDLPEPAPPELYNLREDPGETRNRAADEPDRVFRMQRALENWFEDVEHDRRSIPNA